MKKRSCERFSIPGMTLYYKNKPGFLRKHDYSDSYYPVVDMSRGGAKFLCSERLKAGMDIIVKITIPGSSQHLEIMAAVKWISKNPEQSYRYQTGVAFNSYGDGKNENPKEMLSLLESLEKKSEKLL